MKNIDLAVEDIAKNSTRVMNKDALISQMLFWTAIEFNRYSLRKDIKNKSDIVNYFTMVFMASGSGKGYGAAKTKEFFDFSNYSDQMEIVYDVVRDGFEDVDTNDSHARYMPSSETITIEGTSAGMFNVAEAVYESSFGSVNIYADEFLDHVATSTQSIGKLKEAYDGEFRARIIVGDAKAKKMRDIENLPSNFLGMASLDNASSETMKILERLSKGGLYRRSIIVVDESHPEFNDDRVETFNTKVSKKITASREHWRADFNSRMSKFGNMGTLLAVYPSDDWVKEESYLWLDKWLVDRANENKIDSTLLWDVGASEVILNIAYLVAFLDNKEVTREYVDWAKDYFIRTRDGIGNAMRDRRDYEEITYLLHNQSGLSQADMLQLDRHNCIPQASGKFKDAIKVVREIAYKQGKSLTITRGAVERFSIVQQESTNLKKLIFSFDNDSCKDEKKAIAFSPEYLSWADVDRLAVSDKVRSFTTCHYEMSNKTDPDGHRRAENYIEACNVIAFDIDDGMTIEDACEALDGYVFLLYTTKSHTDQDHRFRIIIPVAKKFEVTSEQYKDMMTNVAEFLGLTLDTKARNVSRLFFTNKNAKIVIKREPHQSDDPDLSIVLLDIEPCMPDTDMRENYVQFISERREYAAKLNFGGHENRTEEEEIRDRIDGFVNKAYSTIAVGNLNDTLYRLGAFIYDLTKNKAYIEQEIRSLCLSKGIPMSFAEEAINRF